MPVWAEKPNPYTRLFAQSIEQGGLDMRDFAWHDLLHRHYDTVIFHWPDRFLRKDSVKHQLRTQLRLGLMKIHRATFGTNLSGSHIISIPMTQ